MIGVGIEMLERYGYALGSTFLEGIVSAINTPFLLFKTSLLVSQPYGVTNFVGMHLRGAPHITSIVPGTICEFYFNFGIIGVIIGYYLVGRFATFCSEKIMETTSLGTVAILSYVLALICTSIIPGTTTTWIYKFVTNGFPAVCLFLFESLFQRRKRYSQHMIHPEHRLLSKTVND